MLSSSLFDSNVFFTTNISILDSSIKNRNVCIEEQEENEEEEKENKQKHAADLRKFYYMIKILVTREKKPQLRKCHIKIKL